MTEAHAPPYWRAVMKRVRAALDSRPWWAPRSVLDELAQREQQQRQRQHAQELEALGRVASSVAHDLNNFLVPIVLYTEMVRRQLAPESQEHALLGHVLSASHDAKALIERVLALSRKPPPPDGDVLLSELVAHCIEQQREALPASVRVVLALDAPCAPVFVNRAALAQVIGHLVRNAVDAMPAGGTLTLGVHCSGAPHGEGSRAAHGVARLTVRDTGVGMDERTAARVFEPFFTTKALGQGNGLGLATAHRIVASLGGHIRFETAPGRGTTFTVELPTHLRPPSPG